MLWLTYISSGIFPHWVNHSHTPCARSLSKVLSVYVLISERRNAATIQDYCVTLTLLLISQHLSCGGVCVHMCACVCVTRNTEGTTKQTPITSTSGITGKTPLSNPCINKRCWCGSVTHKSVLWRWILTCRVMAWVRWVCHSQLIISENERVWITRLTMQFLMSKPKQGKQKENQRRNKHNQQVYRKQNTNVPNDTNHSFLTITCDLCLQLFYPASVAVAPVLKDTFCFKDTVQVACDKTLLYYSAG